MCKLYIERVRCGLTQQMLAEKAGVSRRTIVYLEQGKRLPSMRVGLRLSDALGCSLEEVFRDVLL